MKRENIHRVSWYVMWLSYMALIYILLSNDINLFRLTHSLHYKHILIIPSLIMFSALIIYLFSIDFRDPVLKEIEWRVTALDGSLDTIVTSVSAVGAINKFTDEYLPSELDAQIYMDKK